MKMDILSFFSGVSIGVGITTLIVIFIEKDFKRTRNEWETLKAEILNEINKNRSK